MKKCRLENNKVIPCEEMQEMIRVDNRVELSEFVTMSDVSKVDMTRIIYTYGRKKKEKIFFSYCPICGGEIH